jgi:hypothetical protein
LDDESNGTKYAAAENRVFREHNFVHPLRIQNGGKCGSRRDLKAISKEVKVCPQYRDSRFQEKNTFISAENQGKLLIKVPQNPEKNKRTSVLSNFIMFNSANLFYRVFQKWFYKF